MKPASQRAAILAHLQAGRTITHLECLLDYKWGSRLSARIGEIRAEYGRDAVLSEREGEPGYSRYRWNPALAPQGSLFEGAA